MFKNVQLAKEVRPLLWPWIGAVAAGALIAVKPMVDGAGMQALLTGVIGYGFLGGLALVATLSFGHELQDRTLPLLLTQPLSRLWVWNQKMLIVSGAVFAAALVEFGLLLGASGWYSGDELHETLRATFRSEEIFIAGVFLLATVCSCGFWTLFAGSIIGGLVFTVSAQFITAVIVALAWGRFRGYDEPFQDGLTFLVVAGAGLLYSAVFLWLGWRKFMHLEVRTGSLGDSGSSAAPLARVLVWPRWLASRPTGPVLNIVKKELRLQKTVFQMAVVFTICWMAVLLLQILRPKQNIVYLLDIMACLYAPIASLFAGCIPLGEEKVVGLTAAQLTLPFSVRLQWLLKLMTSATTAAIFCVGLPLALFRITAVFVGLRPSEMINSEDAMLALALVSALAFLMGYWAISLTPNAVRAALVAVSGTILLWCCAGAGIWGGTAFKGLASVPLTSIMCHFHLSPDVVQAEAARWGPKLGCFIVPVITLVMLAQSLVQFRRLEDRGRKLAQCAGLVALLVFVGAFLSADYVACLHSPAAFAPVDDLRNALNTIALTEAPPLGHKARVVLPEEMEGRISAQTSTWLRGARVSYVAVGKGGFGNGDTAYQASILFPNGSSFNFLGGFVTDRFQHDRRPVW